VRGERLAATAIYIGGLAAVLVGIALQFTIGGKSIQVALVAFLASRAVLSFWQALRPQAVPLATPSRLLACVWGVVWLAFAIGVSLPFWAYR